MVVRHSSRDGANHCLPAARTLRPRGVIELCVCVRQSVCLASLLRFCFCWACTLSFFLFCLPFASVFTTVESTTIHATVVLRAHPDKHRATSCVEIRQTEILDKGDQVPPPLGLQCLSSADPLQRRFEVTPPPPSLPVKRLVERGE